MANKVQDQQVMLESFEWMAHTGQHEAANRALVQILQGIEIGALPSFVPPSTGLPVVESQVATRIVGGIAALASSRSFVLSQDGFEMMCDWRDVLHGLYLLSGYENPAFFRYLLGQHDSAGGVDYNEAQLVKLLAYSTLETVDEMTVDILRQLPANISAPALLGFLGQINCVAPQAEAGRQQLLRLGAVLEQARFSDRLALQSHRAWMHCSYSERPEKHTLKRHINGALKRWLESRGVRPQVSAAASGSDRPTLLIPLERFTGDHAMFRCFAHIIEQLRESFRLVAMAQKDTIDAEGRALFDAVVLLDTHGGEPKPLVGTVIKQRPDAILYPSIGMSPWTIWLANLRLAPVQMMMGGHPATSASSEIDYFLVPEGVHLDAACFSEKIVYYTGEQFEFTAHPECAAIDPIFRESPEVCTIGLPASLFKLGPMVLDACREIAGRVARPVEFRFFPSISALQAQAMERQIRQVLPGARVYPRTGYAEYMARLNECDIALGTYPFGATNCACDAALLGIPWVCWDGPELHTGAEWPLLEQIGAPDWLRVWDREGFIAAAVRLLETPEERLGLAAALRERAQVLFGRGNRPSRGKSDIAETVAWLLRHHAVVRGDERRSWRAAERAEWSAALAGGAASA